VTLGTFLQPTWIVILLAWSFIVLSAVQLTVRLIRAYSIPSTALAAVVLTLLTLMVSVPFDLALGADPGLGRLIELAPLAMVLMGLAGYGVARWVLKFRRVRGQVVAGCMVGLLDPHLFVLLAG
jgi:putative effector of murein hydrolase